MATQGPSETSGNFRELADLSEALGEILDIDSMEILTILDSFSREEFSDLRSFLAICKDNQKLAISLVNAYKEAGMDSITACLTVGHDFNYRAQAQQQEPKPSKKLQRFVSFLLDRLPIE